MDEYGICNHCDGPLSLEHIRQGRCYSCNNFVNVWEIGFMGDIHETVERKSFTWKDIVKK